MFFNSFKNLFKEMYFEGAGYDVKQMKEESKRKQEAIKNETIIFSKKSKHIIRAFGILFFTVALLCISSGISNRNYIEVIKYIFMFLLDLAGMICVTIKNKKTETVGLCIVIVFIILNFVVPVI